MSSELARALNRVAKWRTVFTGWQLGTRVKGDPEGDAVRDAAEARILLRVEASALAALLVEKTVFTEEEWGAELTVQAILLDQSFAERFPGFRSTDDGMVMTPEAAETVKGWLP